MGRRSVGGGRRAEACPSIITDGIFHWTGSWGGGLLGGEGRKCVPLYLRMEYSVAHWEVWGGFGGGEEETSLLHLLITHIRSCLFRIEQTLMVEAGKSEAGVWSVGMEAIVVAQRSVFW